MKVRSWLSEVPTQDPDPWEPWHREPSLMQHRQTWVWFQEEEEEETQEQEHWSMEKVAVIMVRYQTLPIRS